VGDQTRQPSPAGAADVPLVSIVTPTFNSARYLRQTLECVARQSYRSIEHIVIDGGSTDETLLIVKEFPSIRWISEPDNGMYDAINKGLRMTSGSICAYLNADDLYFPDTIERVVKCFHLFPVIDLIFGHCQYIDQDGRELFTRRYPEFNWTLFAVLDGSTIPQQTSFWRRSVLESAGFFDTSFKMAGDFEFFMRVGRQCAVRRLGGSPLAQFRFHPDMQTINRKALNEAEIERIHKLYAVNPHWAVPLLRLIARSRYRVLNYRRLREKLRDRMSGKQIIYRP
jgi:glycosyltransferase involved in cell wall biosynthesis